MKLVTKLRGHHLGVIYDVVAILRGDISRRTEVEIAICCLANRIGNQGYPKKTVTEVKNILNKIFLEKPRIEIVPGLDDICFSGCLKNKEKKTENKKLPESTRIKFLEYVNNFCRNKEAQADQDLLKIYGFKPGEYSAQEIIAKSQELWSKYMAYHWDELIEAACL